MPMPTTLEKIGPEVWQACQTHDLPTIKALTLSLAHDRYYWDCLLAASSLVGSIDIADWALQNGAKPIGMLGRIALAKPYENSERVYRYLVETGAVDIDWRIDRQGPILGIVAADGRHSLVRFLLEKGAGVNETVMMYGHLTPLACAAKYADVEMMDLLIENGAMMGGSCALMHAAENGMGENVKALLARGVDVNESPRNPDPYRRDKTTDGPALNRAVFNGHEDVVKILLEAGADPSLRDPNGQTAGNIAEEKGLKFRGLL